MYAVIGVNENAYLNVKKNDVLDQSFVCQLNLLCIYKDQVTQLKIFFHLINIFKNSTFRLIICFHSP